MLLKNKCFYCGKDFTRQIYPWDIKNGRGKFCSRRCSTESQKKQLIRECQWCGKKISLAKSKIKAGEGKYCSISCYHNSIQTKYIKLNCPECNKEFLIPDYRIKDNQTNYCSTSCANKHKLGSASHNWKGGLTKISDCLRKRANYKLWKKNVFKRDNYTCQMCGNINNLHAHHIDKVKDFPEKITLLSNGITLCKDCHNSVNWHETEWRSYFYFILNFIKGNNA